MKLAMFDDARVGLVTANTVQDLTEALAVAAPGARTIAELIDAEPLWPRLTELADGAPTKPLDQIQLAAPLARPGKIIAAPVNYVDHQTEMSQTVDIRSLGVFLKASSSVLDPGGQIQLPYSDRRFDHEAELAVVIGRKTHQITEASALDAVFGYTCLLDMTMRGGEDRSTRKSFDTFTPLGPWITTADEIPDPGSLQVRCTVNGEVRQCATTADLIWSVPQLISYISSVMTLYPGDVIATGTPAGVSSVSDGDHIEASIDAIGTLAVTVTDHQAVPCPTAGHRLGPVPPPDKRWP